MFEIIQGILAQTVEYQNWGWNATTVSALGIVILTIPEIWGLWKQNRAIWTKHSGESVSIVWFSYGLYYFAACMIYDISIRSAASVFNAVALASLHIPILTGLWKFKRYTAREIQLHVLSVAMPILMLAWPQKTAMFMVFSMGAIAAMLAQPLELIATKKQGVVEIRLLVGYILPAGFFCVFGFAIGNWAFLTTSGSAMLILVWTAALWWMYRRRNIAAVV